jgi:hypothetical protein
MEGIFQKHLSFCLDEAVMFVEWFDWVKFAARMLWIRVKALCRPIPPRGAIPYKIYAFNETPVGNFHEVFSAKRDDLENVRKKLGWDEYRIEIRYAFRGNKYRVVYRRDDGGEFPPPRDMKMVVAPKINLACLIRRGDGRDVDVTDRVRKYFGPDRDFHSKGVKIQDMFPFDDHDDNAERFEALGVWLSSGKYMQFEYEKNDVVAI